MLAMLAALYAAAPVVHANPVLDTSAPSSLSLFNLGNVPAIPAQYSNQIAYEGLAITGDNLLLSVGNAATATQIVWELPLVRSNGHIVSFGSPDAFASVLGYPASCSQCFGNIMAGGLVVSGSDLLYTTMANSFLGQYTGGNTSLLDLAATGAFTGGLQYIPPSLNGAGQLKISSSDANGAWYTLNLGNSLGNYTLNSFTQFNVGVPAFSFDYIPADATFSAPGVILGDAQRLRLDYYRLDANGNPCNPDVDTSCAPVIHLVNGDIQIGLGLVRDPVTGDILFTTSDNEIWRLSEEAPEPSTVALAIAGLGALALLRRRARR